MLPFIPSITSLRSDLRPPERHNFRVPPRPRTLFVRGGRLAPTFAPALGQSLERMRQSDARWFFSPDQPPPFFCLLAEMRYDTHEGRSSDRDCVV